VTDEQHMIMGSLEPYEDTVLIKADANGNVLGATSLTASRQGTVADESSFLIMRNMSVGTEEVNVPIIKQVKPSVTNIDDKQRSITAHAKTNVTKNCSLLNTGRAAGRRSSRQGAVPQATTYPQIKYDSATEAKIETEKSRQVHAELLPILLKIFNNQVKMTDNTSGLWLTYFFPRQVTVADREAVQKAYVDLGYKVDEAEEGLLHVSKVGISLRMTFSVNNSMVGKLEVML